MEQQNLNVQVGDAVEFWGWPNENYPCGRWITGKVIEIVSATGMDFATVLDSQCGKWSIHLQESYVRYPQGD